MSPRQVTLGFLFLLFASPSQGGDWPHLRGPNYDAISPEKGLIETWPESGPPILWTRDLGQGYSGFVAAGQRVWTQYQSRTGQYVLCLDADTGAEIWQRRVDWAWQSAGAYPGPYATPTWHQGRIYYSTPSGIAGCLGADDGRSLWSVEVKKKFEGEGTGFGYAATPLVEVGKVILPVGGPGASVVALDARDGSTVWAVGDDPASYCPAYPITYRGRRLVVALLQNTLAAHDLATGKMLWRHELSQGYDEHSAWPLYAEPDLLVSGPFRRGARLYRFQPDQEPTTIWASRGFSNDVASSVLVGGQVYGFDLQQLQASAHRTSRGVFRCVDFATGKLRWETDQVGHATVLVADGKLILLNDTGTLILARANPSAYEELARAKLFSGSICWAPPTLSYGRLFVRSPSRAMCVYLGPRDLLDPERELAASPSRTFELDRTWIMTREPEYPHDAPSVRDLGLWFGWCLGGVFGGAGVVASLMTILARWSQRPGAKKWFSTTYAISAFLLGLVGTSVFSIWADTFVLTWPASLYVAFRVTLAVVVWAEPRPVQRRRRLLARGVTLLFLALLYGYYRLCVEMGYPMAWGFLAGFLPAAPMAVLAARSQRSWLVVLADITAFAVYFWVSGLLPGWKDRWVE
jgi:outer membrane protein assembly factor BamB